MAQVGLSHHGHLVGELLVGGWPRVLERIGDFSSWEFSEVNEAALAELEAIPLSGGGGLCTSDLGEASSKRKDPPGGLDYLLIHDWIIGSSFDWDIYLESWLESLESSIFGIFTSIYS